MALNKFQTLALSGAALMSAFSTTACTKDANATEPQAQQFALAEESAQGAVIQYGEGIEDADLYGDMVEKVTGLRTYVYDNGEPGLARLIVLSQDCGTFTQSEMDRGKLTASAINAKNGKSCTVRSGRTASLETGLD